MNLTSRVSPKYQQHWPRLVEAAREYSRKHEWRFLTTSTAHRCDGPCTKRNYPSCRIQGFWLSIKVNTTLLPARCYANHHRHLQGEIEWFELLLESLMVTFELLMLSQEQTKPDPLQLLAMESSLMLLAHWVSCAHPACKLDKKASVSQAIGQCSQHGTLQTIYIDTNLLAFIALLICKFIWGSKKIIF